VGSGTRRVTLVLVAAQMAASEPRVGGRPVRVASEWRWFVQAFEPDAAQRPERNERPGYQPPHPCAMAPSALRLFIRVADSWLRLSTPCCTSANGGGRAMQRLWSSTPPRPELTFSSTLRSSEREQPVGRSGRSHGTADLAGARSRRGRPNVLCPRATTGTLDAEQSLKVLKTGCSCTRRDRPSEAAQANGRGRFGRQNALLR
jgi:hypothetical protein